MSTPPDARTVNPGQAVTYHATEPDERERRPVADWPANRKAVGTQTLADRCREAGLEPSLVLEILRSPEAREALGLPVRVPEPDVAELRFESEPAAPPWPSSDSANRSVDDDVRVHDFGKSRGYSCRRCGQQLGPYECWRNLPTDEQIDAWVIEHRPTCSGIAHGLKAPDLTSADAIATKVDQPPPGAVEPRAGLFTSHGGPWCISCGKSAAEHHAIEGTGEMACERTSTCDPKTCPGCEELAEQQKDAIERLLDAIEGDDVEAARCMASAARSAHRHLRTIPPPPRTYRSTGLAHLPPGLYRLHWVAGESTLAAVGMSSDGSRWFAPVTWTVSRVPCTKWELVERAEEVRV